MNDPNERLRAAIRRLHARKSAAYGRAWKKRGEVMSVVANIARKVDRLEAVAAGAPATEDESLLDSALDLLVYCLKYTTYLADQDAETAVMVGLSPRTDGSLFSDGIDGFEALLAEIDLGPFSPAESPQTVSSSAHTAIIAFEQLERCFDQPTSSIETKIARLLALT